MPCSHQTPAGPRRQATSTLRCCLPPSVRRRLPQLCEFRGSLTRPTHSLSTLHRSSYPHGARLAPGWRPPLPDGLLPAGSHKKVSERLFLLCHLFPLLQALPGAHQVSHLVCCCLDGLVRLLSVCPIRSATAANAGLVRGTSDAPVCRPCLLYT